MSTTIAWTDAELLDGLAERRMEAFEALVERHADRLYGVAWRITGSRQDAEEVVQDAFVRAHRALFETYSPTRVRELALRPWLYAIALNGARNRRRGRRPERSLDEPERDGYQSPEPAAGGPSPPLAAELAELVATIERELLQLPHSQRAAIVLRLVEGLSYEEAAAALGRPVGTVKSDTHRGLRRLRQRLGPLVD
jgi:RNA polymerase sigma-70 factor, ECF subfamily